MARHGSYGSAADIPSIADMLRKIERGKLLTRFIARDQRTKLVELEQQVREHVAVVDRFYAVLGPRNWIVHDDLPIRLLEAIGGMAADDAERQLVADTTPTPPTTTATGIATSALWPCSGA